MALIPSAAYPGQIDTTDANYPQGKAKNVTVSGDGTGTPLEKDWINDIWGFLQALLAYASITPSGTPDKVGASDYLNAILAKFMRGPASSTANALARFADTGGKLTKSTGVTIDDSDNVLTTGTISGAQLTVGASGVSVTSGGNVALSGGNGNVTLAGTGEVGYSNTRSRTVRFAALDASTLYPGSSWTGSPANSAGFLQAGALGSRLQFNLRRRLPIGAVITSITARVNMAVSRATSTDRPSLQVWQATGDGTASQIGSTTFCPSSSTGWQTITISGLSTTVSNQNQIIADVLSGGTSTVSDQVGWVEVTFDDPGPRNY